MTSAVKRIVAVNAGLGDPSSTRLLAAWLASGLDVPVRVTPEESTTGIRRVVLHRASGPIDLERAVPNVATLAQPGQPTHDVSLPRRSLRDCLAE